MHFDVSAEGLTVELPTKAGTFLMLPWLTIAVGLLVVWLFIMLVYYAFRGGRGNRD